LSRRDGFLLVNKPGGVTSFDVIRKMRTIFSCKKIGHAGTLDPDATGLLILAFERATRLLSYLNIEPKIYHFTVRFGEETDTLDSTGTLLQTGGSLPSANDIQAALPSFTGTLQQVPPAYSAVKCNGKRAYALARKGEIPELSAREITVAYWKMLEYDAANSSASFEVACSGGTYVRSLARDLALSLGTFGHTTRIHREACGAFTSEHAVAAQAVTADTPVVTIPEALSHLPVVGADEKMIQEISFGRDVTLAGKIGDHAEIALAMNGADFVALLSRKTGTVFHPAIVGTIQEGEGV